MSTPTPSKPPPQLATDAASRAKVIHNVALGALIVCPIIILLPPRKLDIYTLALISGTLIGGNQIAYEYTGRSIATRWQDRMQSVAGANAGLPPKALEMQKRMITNVTGQRQSLYCAD